VDAGGVGGAVDAGGVGGAVDASGETMAVDARGDAPPGPVCGNGVKEGSEECDDGAALNTGGYGKCNSNCTLGPRCGDRMINGAEVCDNGSDNALTVGACNPACTGTVNQKTIKIFNMFGGENGNLTNDWDPFCNTQFGPNYKALLVDGMTRIASATAYKGDGQVDWVLKPYTAYVNATLQPLWTTDAVALLGVRNGQRALLLGTFGGSNGDYAWAGFESDWTTSSNNCGRWTIPSANGGTALPLGPSATTAEVIPIDCSSKSFILCVEQ
jgi:hypothetical protein